MIDDSRDEGSRANAAPPVDPMTLLRCLGFGMVLGENSTFLASGNAIPGKIPSSHDGGEPGSDWWRRAWLGSQDGSGHSVLDFMTGSRAGTAQ